MQTTIKMQVIWNYKCLL